MSKPREFWIQIKNRHFSNSGSLDASIYTPKHIEVTQDYDLDWHNSMCVHVREVVPIDWADVWKTAGQTQKGTWFELEQKIQELVEKQLKGES